MLMGIIYMRKKFALVLLYGTALSLSLFLPTCFRAFIDDSVSSTELEASVSLNTFTQNFRASLNGERFTTVSGLGYGLDSVLFVVDRDTKVIYWFLRSGGAGGLTPLIDSDGTPVLYEGE